MGSFPTVTALFPACYKSPGAVSRPVGTLVGVPTASLGRRFAALLIDWLIALLTVALFTGTDLSGTDAASPFLNLGVFFLQVWLLTGLLGFTIGKRLLGLRVENPFGAPIGLARAFTRSLLLCLVIPALIQNDEGRGFHDVAAGSRVVRAG